jgi:hypothetical protein
LLVVAVVLKIVIHQMVELLETVEPVVVDKVQVMMVIQDVQQRELLTLVVAVEVKHTILNQLEQVVAELL